MSVVPFVTGRTDTRAEIPGLVSGIRLTFADLMKIATNPGKAGIQFVSAVQVDALRPYQGSGNVLWSVAGLYNQLPRSAVFERRSLRRLNDLSI